MKRSLLMCAALTMLLGVPQVQADNIQLTLDLKNTTAGNAASGGTWQLYARKVETGTGAQGDFGISAIRALINGINEASITTSTTIGDQNGGPYTNTLSNGVVEIVYGQNLGGTPAVVNGVGIGANPNADTLIASGTWPAGATRPTFGSDPDSFASEGNFLGGNSAPYPVSVEAGMATPVVVTLGDINASNTADLADIQPFVNIIGGAPYNPAADIDQNGVADLADIQPFVNLLAGSLSAISTVPEPTSGVLLLASGMALVSFRRVR